jgi:CFEM domain
MFKCLLIAWINATISLYVAESVPHAPFSITLESPNLPCTVFVGVLNLAAAVVAQTGPQASKIPACVVCRCLLLEKSYALFVLIINQLPCDTKAIATTTCNSTDIPCHCQQKNNILTSIIPCVLHGSNCTAPVQDLYSEWSFCFLPCIF